MHFLSGSRTTTGKCIESTSYVSPKMVKQTYTVKKSKEGGTTKMGFAIKINPVDLQDRQAFLSFLREQGKCGLQAIRVLPTHTYFKRVSGAFTQYDLSFDNGEKEAQNLFAYKNGIVICPSPSTIDDLTWCKKVVSDYDRFTMYSRVRLFSDFFVSS